jgi:hypothetical protein
MIFLNLMVKIKKIIWKKKINFIIFKLNGLFSWNKLTNQNNSLKNFVFIHINKTKFPKYVTQ